MQASLRGLCALACLTACLVLVACGDEEPAGSPASSSGGAHGGLGEERYAKIEAVYVAALELDGLAEDAGADDFADVVRTVVRACEALERGDPLLASLRRSCAVTDKFTRQTQRFFEGCSGEDFEACESSREVAATAAQLEDASRRGDEAVRAAGLDDDCEDALVTRESDYETFAKSKQAFELFATALRTGSDEALGEAERLLVEAGQGGSTGSQELERFRQGCG